MRLAVIASLATLAFVPAAAQGSAPVIPVAERSAPMLSGSYPRLNGTPINLARLRGRVVLVVNTASRCGYTDQFRPLEALWRQRRAQGLTVLGVPARDFQQELPTDAQVKRFCERNFGVTFPMLRVSNVTGPRAIPLFKRLSAPRWSKEPQWNFNKYLVDRRGRVAMYFPASVDPGSPAMRKAVAALLAEPRGAAGRAA